MRYDLIIKDCLVVDPRNGVKNYKSVAIKDGRVAGVGDMGDAYQNASFPGAVLMPGLIDCHVHCSDWIGGPLSFVMLARSGVTTAVDMAGPADVVMRQMKEYGSGINVAILEALYPGKTIEGNNPSYDEIRRGVDRMIRGGALGLKLIGGHYPMTPEASAAAIKAANDRRCYVAVHAGSTKNGSNLKGALDAFEFSEGRPFHLAHINAYCRGMTGEDPKDELKTLLKALAGNPGVISEFHAAPLNGTSGKCTGGVPESHITRNCLRMGGYPETEDGLKNALAAEYAHCVWEDLNGANETVSGEKALNYWKSRNGNAICCFPVNDREVAFLCATAKDAKGEYVIDALSTDGGGIPRNFLLRYGYLLVEWGAWTIEEYVMKTSVIPAKMLGLTNKGHLSAGADADITVFDPASRKALLTVVGGNVVYAGGVCTGTGGTVLCMREGSDAAEKTGLRHEVVNVERSMLYTR